MSWNMYITDIFFMGSKKERSNTSSTAESAKAGAMLAWKAIIAFSFYFSVDLVLS